MSIKPIILCGGSGTRLWPESRKSMPKQFKPIVDKKSLLDLTIERLIEFKNAKKPIIISAQDHSFYIKKILEKYKINATLMLEPEGKNTTAAIYLAAKSSDKTDNLIIMPSDHLIPDKIQFAILINKIDNLNNFDHWITLGVKPTNPSEAFGYISTTTNNNTDFLNVISFHEKPNKQDAERMINVGNCFWNSGIFLGNAEMIINSIQKHAPEIAFTCDKVFAKKNTLKNYDEINFNKELFKKIPSKSIDYSVMEYETNIKLYPLDCKWNDVGSWDAISELKNISLNNKKVIQINSKNNFIRSNKRVIATIGINDVIIIDSDNATLIAKKGCSEKVKTVVNRLAEQNMVEANEYTFENRPWGKFENLLDTPECKVKKIEVFPLKRLSLQYHKYRSEHWYVIKGEASVYLNGNKFILKLGESINISVGDLHYLENETRGELIIIETQLGTYFGEDDIIRLDDPYGR